MLMESSSKQLTFLSWWRQNVSKVEMVGALFVEAERRFLEALDIRIAGRYEEMKNESSFDPKLSMKYKFNDSLTLRFSREVHFQLHLWLKCFLAKLILVA